MNVLDLLNEQPKEDISTIECRICGKKRPRDTKSCPHCDAPGRIVTLAEWGQRLPIGLFDEKSKVLHKEFESDKIDWNKERDISNAWNLMSSQENLKVVDYVLCILGECIKNLSGVNFQKHAQEQKNLILREMFVGDIFYMYLFLRVASLGKEFTLKNLKCPTCKERFDYCVDLSTTEIAVIDSIDDIYSKIELEDGFMLSGELRKNITVKPTTFNSLMGINSTNEAEIWAEMVQGCVIDIEGTPPETKLTTKEISTFSKSDIEIINEDIGIVSGGPDWDVDVKCPHCQATYIEIIDWEYSNFFRRSSRSRKRRRRSRN